MGDLNLTAFQSRVLLALGNAQTSHPVVAAGLHTQAINDAANDLIRRFPDHFPEHTDVTWTLGPTTVGLNSIALPDNLNVIVTVRHSNGTTITSGNWTSVEEEVVAETDAETIGLLNKDSTVTGYPKLFARKGTNLIYHPTTRTGYTTTFRLYGMSGETRLSAGGDTFRMNRDFDEAVVLLGAAKLARIIGYTERADELEMAAERKVGRGLSVVNFEAPPSCIVSPFDFGRCD
jgi:hypothetical protein